MSLPKNLWGGLQGLFRKKDAEQQLDEELSAYLEMPWPRNVSLLYGVSPWDPVSFTLVPGLLFAVALAACWVPARRAARVDPVESLRCG